MNWHTPTLNLKRSIDLNAIAHFLDEFFAVEQYPNDQNGIYTAGDRPLSSSENHPIHRIGLALEPWSGLTNWTTNHRLDALFLHRPWQLQPDQLLPHIGILAYHLAFDEQLTLGFNPRLAVALGISGLEVLGYKEERAIGMIGNIAPQFFTLYADRVRAAFGGCETVSSPTHPEVTRVAVVGAMTDALVREAADRQAQIYITGQLRQPAELAVTETGIGVIAIGHRRTEIWGLQALAGVLRERWATLEVILPRLK